MQALLNAITQPEQFVEISESLAESVGVKETLHNPVRRKPSTISRLL